MVQPITLRQPQGFCSHRQYTGLQSFMFGDKITSKLLDENQKDEKYT